MALNTKQQNLYVSYQFIEFIQSADRAIVGHLYKFQSATGINDYFTDLDTDINYEGQIWKSGSLRIEGLRRKLAVGLQVDEQETQIWAGPSDTLFGANFLTGAESGLMDGAIIARLRAVWNYVTGNAAIDVQNAPIAVWPMFTGYASQITKGGQTHVDMKIKSALVKLEVNMPQNYYQPGCLWTLFSPGCTLIKSAFAVSGTVGAGPTNTTIPVVGGIATPIAADSIANFAQGRLLFTSGVNSGLQVLIDTNDAANLYLAYNLNAVPSPSDTFNYYPGCSKSFNTCDLKFNNKANFRGYDKVPPIMLSI